MVAEDGFLWALVGDDTVIRIDLASGEVIDSLSIPEVFCDAESGCGFSRRDALIVGDDVWIVGAGLGRINRSTLAVDIFARGDDSNFFGGAKLLGEAGGTLWTLGSHDGDIRGLDPATFEQSEYEIHMLTGIDTHESTASLVGNHIWLVPCCDRRIARFDTSNRQIDEIDTGGGWHTAVANGGLWLASDSHIERIDLAAGILTDSLPSDGALGAVRSVVADLDGGIWISHSEAIVRVDSATRRVTHTADLAGGGQLLPVDGGVWLASEDGTISRIEYP